MIIYSTYLKAIFWIFMGLLYALMIAGAPVWADDLGLHMNWWKWVLASLWYVFLSYSFGAAFTLMGEKEPGAWYKFLGSHLALAVILGSVLWCVI